AIQPQQQPSVQPLPRQLCRPSFTATTATARAARGSAHHQPRRAFAPRPTSSATERYAQSGVWEASLTAAEEWSLEPTWTLARPSSGIVTAVNAARAIPIQLVRG